MSASRIVDSAAAVFSIFDARFFDAKSSWLSAAPTVPIAVLTSSSKVSIDVGSVTSRPLESIETALRSAVTRSSAVPVSSMRKSRDTPSRSEPSYCVVATMRSISVLSTSNSASMFAWASVPVFADSCCVESSFIRSRMDAID